MENKNGEDFLVNILLYHLFKNNLVENAIQITTLFLIYLFKFYIHTYYFILINIIALFLRFVKQSIISFLKITLLEYFYDE